MYGIPGQIQHLDAGHVFEYLRGHGAQPVVRQVQNPDAVHADESFVGQRAA